MPRHRAPAVAGSFYPLQPAELRSSIRRYLEAAPGGEGEAADRTDGPKAIIVPHAGYIYSGPVAASAYAALKGSAGRVNRVVLLGPAHTTYLRAIAAPRAEAFDTPLGPVSVDAPTVEEIAQLPGVVLDDAPHRHEHCLEVQLPFLKEVLGDVSIVPLLVGDVAPEVVARVLDRLWDGPETLIVLSTDLSHYLAYDAAQRRDSTTAAAIEDMDSARLSPDAACGFHALAGLLTVARERHAVIARLDLRNSGDTAGPRDRVVGYGAWTLMEKAA